MTFFRRLSFKRTQKVPLDGERTLVESILLSVLVALLLVAALISLSLMTPTPNKKQNLDDLKCFYLHGSGSSQGQSSVLCRAVQLL